MFRLVREMSMVDYQFDPRISQHSILMNRVKGFCLAYIGIEAFQNIKLALIRVSACPVLVLS